MAERSYPFVKPASQSTGYGTTTDAEYSAMMSKIVLSGVVGSSADSKLKPFGDSSGLFVKVPAGEAFTRGHFYTSDATITLPIDVGTSMPRLDAIVIRMQYGSINEARIYVKKGVPAATPVLPAITQDPPTASGTFELLLGSVAVAANSSLITAANVVDRRAFTGLRFDNLPGMPATFPPAIHNHDTQYYTQAQIDSKLMGRTMIIRTGVVDVPTLANNATTNVVFHHTGVIVYGFTVRGMQGTPLDNRLSIGQNVLNDLDGGFSVANRSGSSCPATQITWAVFVEDTR
ncbi:hypothetical protein [Glaciibacter psychrotolerans]|uniref:Uncharacterized protein n=1 Tax=Glaciibacter psychrotolerans TaxID=670054 RepID=A0A7Z0ECQ5_9MICO|nr:hypothetical protein [Leifsonia psychrotolerans]NYJ19209.1 hypothetical protein [Leifsonia psychrotolerans]